MTKFTAIGLEALLVIWHKANDTELKKIMIYNSDKYKLYRRVTIGKNY